MKYFIIGLIIATSAQARIIDVKKVLNVVEKDFPKITQQKEKVISAEGKVRKAKGSFDSSLRLKRKSFVDSYYTANLNDISINKPLPFANSELDLGYRKGTGRIPIYNQEDATDDQGEFYLRFNVSLLRYRSIDENRFDLWVSKNNLLIEKHRSLLQLIDSKLGANEAYWKWFFYFNKKNIYEELIRLNQERFKAVKRRVERNDLARIYITESRQYLLRFQSELAEVQAQMRQAFEKLRTYYPDLKEGDTPIRVTNFKSVFDEKRFTNDLALARNPQLKMLDLLMKNNGFEIDLAQQKNIPKLDLSLEHYETQDEGAPYLDENVVALKLEIPIERNLAQGDISRAKAENRVIRAQIDLTQREVVYHIENLKARIVGDLRGIELSDLETQSAVKLQKAEWSKFKAGASDFFLLNTRDVNYAKAKVYLLAKYMDFQTSFFNLQQWFNISL